MQAHEATAITIAEYDRMADAYRRGTADHDVSQNISPPSFHAPVPISPDTTACSPRTSSTAAVSPLTPPTKPPASPMGLVVRP